MCWVHMNRELYTDVSEGTGFSRAMSRAVLTGRRGPATIRCHVPRVHAQSQGPATNASHVFWQKRVGGLHYGTTLYFLWATLSKN